MASLKDIFNLAKADGGKFFVMDEQGEPKLVIMAVEEYEKLLLGRVKHEVEEVEAINSEILNARLQTHESPPMPGPVVRTATPSRDLREEVIDPSFDFEGPKFDLEDI